jgi:hypothetical protein
MPQRCSTPEALTGWSARPLARFTPAASTRAAVSPLATRLPVLVQSTHALVPGKTCFSPAASLGGQPSEDPLCAGTAHLADDRFRRSGRQSRSDCLGDDGRVRSGSSTAGADLRFARPVGAIGTCEINGKDAPSVRMRHRHRPPTGPHERFLRKRSSESGRQLEPPACAIALQGAAPRRALDALAPGATRPRRRGCSLVARREGRRGDREEGAPPRHSCATVDPRATAVTCTVRAVSPRP